MSEVVMQARVAFFPESWYGRWDVSLRLDGRTLEKYVAWSPVLFGNGYIAANIWAETTDKVAELVDRMTGEVVAVEVR